MSPLKAGDLAEVVNGASGLSSPNLGKIVTVKSVRGEHTTLGRILRCEGAGISTLSGDGYVITGWADFPTSWLKKIEGPKAKPKTKEKHAG